MNTKQLIGAFIVVLLVGIAIGAFGKNTDAGPTRTEYVTVTETETVTVEVPGMTDECQAAIDAADAVIVASHDIATTQTAMIEAGEELQKAMAISDFNGVTVANAEMQTFQRDLADAFERLAKAELNYEDARLGCTA